MAKSKPKVIKTEKQLAAEQRRLKALAVKRAEQRAITDRVRELCDDVNSIGKNSLKATFELGFAFQEAATLLKGSFGVWVKHQCQIEPRTVLGYRKVAVRLGAHKGVLLETNLTPSAAVVLASAPDATIERVVASLASDRRISVAEMKLAIREQPNEPDTVIGMKAFRKAAREHAAEVTRKLEKLSAALASTERDPSFDIVDAARSLHTQLMAMASGSDPQDANRNTVRALANAVGKLKISSNPEDLGVAASLVQDQIDHLHSAPPMNSVPQESETMTATIKPEPLSRLQDSLFGSVFKHGLTAFEVCAGGGGQAAGLAKAGFKHVGMLEREAGPCKTLRAVFGPEHVIEANLVGYEPGDVGPIDLLAGGVPCQPFSQAGKRKGKDDDRDCFPEALRLVKSLKPRAVMLENVTGLLGPAHDPYRLSILRKLSKMGYEAEWRVVHCTDFGVPQDRKRAILVAFNDKAAMARFKWPVSAGNYAEMPYTMAEALASVLTARGFELPQDLVDRLDRTAPTVIGGSLKKASPDFGQPKSREVWGKIDFAVSRWGDYAPTHDHVGELMPTNKVIAALQGFSPKWPFQGSKRDVYRQIANAFPPVVALHLGCAIASALTGEEFHPEAQRRYEGRHYVITPDSLRRKGGPVAAPSHVERQPEGQRKTLPLALLRETSSMSDPSWAEGDVLDIDYSALRRKFGPWPENMWKHQRQYGAPVGALTESDYAPYEGNDREETEAEHFVQYWVDPEAWRAGRLPEPKTAVTNDAVSESEATIAD